MKYFSMFSGIGGFELGIRQSEIKSENRAMLEGRIPQLPRRSLCVGYSEINKYAIQIYEKHFRGHKNYGDCAKIQWNAVESFDMLVGGFPCQAFSLAGQRRGFDDTRGTLFFDVAKCLREKQPRIFMLENVKGLLSHDKGNTFLAILTTLDELGYDCQWQVLNSKNFGVPQNRERVFIIGHLRGLPRPKVFPFEGEDKKDAKSREEKQKRGSWVSTIDTRYGERWSSETYVRKDDKIRRLTPTECERLQGFPGGWTEGISDTQRYKCIGNAVTVNVIEAIMRKLL